jgi:hypothetical protein
MNANNPVDYSRASPDRSFPGVAVQFRLGLLSERRDRIDLADRTHPRFGGSNLDDEKVDRF